MKELKFKTNIKCDACVNKVTPNLNETVGKGYWKVDLQDPQRILTVEADVPEAEIEKALEKVGYKAEKLN